VATIWGNALNGGDLLLAEIGNPQQAGECRLAVELDCAGAAEAPSAAEFRAGQAELVTQHPEQRGVGIDPDAALLTIDAEFVFGHRALPKGVALYHLKNANHLPGEIDASGAIVLAPHLV
jgi:hypothetical protein